MCFVQGVAWNLILHGWRYWNRSSKFSGHNAGARLRRWWWGVNNWKVPTEESKTRNMAKNVTEVSVAFLKVRTLALTVVNRIYTDCRGSTMRISLLALVTTKHVIYAPCCMGIIGVWEYMHVRMACKLRKAYQPASLILYKESYFQYNMWEGKILFPANPNFQLLTRIYPQITV